MLINERCGIMLEHLTFFAHHGLMNHLHQMLSR